ncbi:MAG: F510_1955 family glycosylhydrolase [Nocardioides sp.]
MSTALAAGPGTHRRPRARHIVASVAVILLAATTAACSPEADDGGGGTNDAVGHVHGLGVDPADGQLMVATHTGLFRLDDASEALELAGPVQDYMGFTVVGAGNFLASGHPGEGQEGPAALGLIESTDGGETWQPVSLSGEVDFHSLDTSGNQTFGLDSGTGSILSSTDRQEWSSGAPTPLADIAVNPDGTQLVGTTEGGVLSSDDGGASFAGLSGSPVVAVVDWGADGTLVGVDPDGVVYSTSDLATWKELADLGSYPQAIAVEDDQIFVAVEDRIVVSDDAGATFEDVIGL